MSNVDRIAQILRDHRKWWTVQSAVAKCTASGCLWSKFGTITQTDAAHAAHLAELIDAVLHPVIETVEQLDALPDHSIVRCAAGAAWHKQELYCSPGEPWWCAGSEIESPASDVMLPARVLYTPEVAR